MAGKVDYEELLAKLGSSQFESLRPAQQDALERYAESHTETVDLAVELPTGAGKSLIALLVGEAWRREGKRVAILTGNKTLARQMEQEAYDLGLAPILMEGRGVDIPPRAKPALQCFGLYLPSLKVQARFKVQLSWGGLAPVRIKPLVTASNRGCDKGENRLGIHDYSYERWLLQLACATW